MLKHHRKKAVFDIGNNSSKSILSDGLNKAHKVGNKHKLSLELTKSLPEVYDPQSRSHIKFAQQHEQHVQSQIQSDPHYAGSFKRKINGQLLETIDIKDKKGKKQKITLPVVDDFRPQVTLDNLMPQLVSLNHIQPSSAIKFLSKDDSDKALKLHSMFKTRSIYHKGLHKLSTHEFQQKLR